MVTLKLTILAEKGENGYYVGQIAEFPAALSQGRTLDELKTNLMDALRLLWITEHDQVMKKRSSKNSIKRSITLKYEA